MGDLKRYPVKYIRDKVKSSYPVKTECYICGAVDELHFHHYNSLAELYKRWTATNNFNVTSKEEILEVRDLFISEHWKELVELGATLCKKHHELLHKLFGKNPKLETSEKQHRWVDKQRAKKYKGVT